MTPQPQTVTDTIQPTPTEGRLVRDLLLLLLACAALWGWTYGRWDFWGPDEPRYVEIARELLGCANPMVLTVMGQPYDQKSPLPYWFMAGGLKLSGGVVTSWTTRLPSVLFGIATVLLTYLIGRRRLSRRAGWLAAWVLLTAPLFIEEVASARLDILMTGWVALAMWAWLAARPGEGSLGAGRCAIFWLGLTGALFIKGPVAWLIVLGTVGIEAWRARSWRVAARLRPVWGLAAMLAVVVAYFLALKASVSGQYVQAQLHTAVWDRLFPKMHREWPWFYLTSLFGGGFLPWSLVLVLALAAWWKNGRDGLHGRDGQNEYADENDHSEIPHSAFRIPHSILIWALWPLLFLSIVVTKREQYLLPAYPALALLIGAYLDARWDTGSVAAWARRLGAFIFLFSGAALIVLAAMLLAGKVPHALLKKPDLGVQLDLVRNASWFAARMGALAFFGLFLAICGALAFKAMAARRAAALLFAALFAAGVVRLGVLYPLLNPVKSPREVNRVVQGLTRAPGEAVGALDTTFKAQYMVYGNYRLVELKSDDDPKTGKDLRNLPDVLRREAARLPRILLSSPGDDKKGKTAAVLAELGYQKIWTAPSPSQDHLAIYVKK